MLTDFKYNRVLIVCILAGLLAALAVGWQRHCVERANRTVELAMEYDDLARLAQTEGVTVEAALRDFKDAGVTSLVVYEDTLEKLSNSGRAAVLDGAALLSQYEAGELSSPGWRAWAAAGKIKTGRIYVLIPDARLFAEVKSDLERRLGRLRVTEDAVDGKPVLVAQADYERTIKWNLGLDSAQMRLADRLGFYVAARPSNYTKVTPEDVDAVFARMADVKNVSTIIFAGDEALGYPQLLPQTERLLTERDITLGLIEHPLQLQFVKQDGLLDLAAMRDYQAARMYVIPKGEQPKLKMDDAVARWALTDRERNIRIDLLRTYEKAASGKSLLETNVSYARRVAEAVRAEGFSPGRARGYEPYFPSRILLALLALGATAAGVLYLTLVKPFAPKYQYVLLVVIAAALIAPILFGRGTLARLAVALASANLFPALAVIWQLDRWRKYRAGGFAPPSAARAALGALAALAGTACLSLTGGLYVGAVLADVRHFLEIDIFRGVKLTFVLPMALVALAFLARFDLFDQDTAARCSIMKQIKKALNCPLYVKSLVVFFAAAAAVFVLVGRSGHTAGLPVPALEIKMRAFLEHVFYARPRTKEFLIGHPAFMLAALALYRRWPNGLFFALALAGTIGQGSLVETFAHLRTPIEMSLARGVGGVALGAALGLIAIGAVQFFALLWPAAGRSTARHE